MQFSFSDDEYRELQIDYLRDTREKATLIRKHVEELPSRSKFKTAFPVLLFLYHQLKGSGGSLGFPRFTQLAQTASGYLNEFLDVEGAPRPRPRELSEKLLRLCDEFDEALRTACESLGC